MPRKTVLFLCPTSWDLHNIARPEVQARYDLLCHGSYPASHPEDINVIEFIEDTLARFDGTAIDGVVSTHDYPGCILAAIVAARRGLPGPRPQATLLAQHKLHCREVQAAACPGIVPEFFAVDPDRPDLDGVPFPSFIKPAKSVLSILACRLESRRDLERYLERVRPHLDGFVGPFNALWRAYGPGGRDAAVLVGEELLKGRQVTVEGFRARGVTRIAGIVDSVMFPGTMSFRSFEYPSRLPPPVLARMSEATRVVIEALDLDDLCFNVELFYDEERDRVALIEVNPRMSYQFADLFEKVDGANTFDVQLAIATGAAPDFRRGAGPFDAAVSFVLRRFDDAVIRRLPSAAQIEALLHDYPDAHIRLFGGVGERLSDTIQDMQSFRYGIVNLGGSTLEHAEARCLELTGRLPIELEPCGPGA